jgi:hypothetical protein
MAMTHQRYKDLLQLSMYEELSDADQRMLDEHTAGCASCREDLARLKRFHRVLAAAPPPRPTVRLITEARQNLRAVLRYEQSRRSVWGRFSDWARTAASRLSLSGMPVPAAVFASILLFCTGILVGVYGLAPGADPMATAAGSLEDSDVLNRGEVGITNVRFLDSDAADGNVEFVFDAVRPIHMKGTVDDPSVQKVLAYAVVNAQNPGVRLRAVNAVSGYQSQSAEGEIKHALITALKTDANPGVRKEAFTVLMNYGFDNDIKEALIHVLTYDDNPALRIEAIGKLEAQVQAQRPDQELVNVFRSRMETDDNTYIRTRARMVLEGLANP